MMFFNPTFNRYLKCYRDSIDIGFVEKDKPCCGEYLHPNKIKKDCLMCPYLHSNIAKEYLYKKGVEDIVN